MEAGLGWCQGCARTLDEIAGWGSASPQAQQRILARLLARRTQLLRHGLWLGPTEESWP